MKALEELKAAYAAATQGEWEVGDLDKNGQRIVRNEHIELFTGWHHCVGSIEKEMEANARLIALLHNALPALIECAEALQALLRRDERNTCQHDTTHRGGAQWEICDLCGAQWADDEGGRPKWKDPQEWIVARAALAKLKEAK